ncbi:MAG: hypothetical protein IMX06_00625 [Kyrpidia tusciae]|nr:hypothetical protein [Kyrpidia tusciae]MBE3551371.1 hypothetical protein [Kyrpidia tusciae]
MDQEFVYPLTMKDGKVFDALGQDVTEQYQRVKQAEAAERMLRALEILQQKKAEGTPTQHLLYVDTAFRYCAVVETFAGDDLSERLNLAYAERVHEDDKGRLFLDKVNRALYPIESLAELYRMAGSGMFSTAVAEAIWDNREAAFYLIRDLWDPAV